MNRGEIIIYQKPDGETNLDVRFRHKGNLRKTFKLKNPFFRILVHFYPSDVKNIFFLCRQEMKIKLDTIFSKKYNVFDTNIQNKCCIFAPKLLQKQLILGTKLLQITF